MRSRRTAVFAASALCLAAATLRAEHPFRFDDLARVERLTAFSVSPDGKWLTYAVTIPDVDENSSKSAIWVKPAGGGDARRLTSGAFKDTAPAFSPDGHRIAFLSNRESSQQIWMLDLGGGEPRRAAAFVNDIGAFRWSPDGRWFVFTSDVFPDCPDAACTEGRLKAREKSKIKARVAERLLYRHWDSWKDGLRTHIWKIPTAGGAAIDLTPGDRDAPAYGGDRDFEVSPDGRMLLYTSNPDKVEALSTNADLWETSFDGRGTPVDLTPGNKAFDGSPAYSPDGRFIAYRAQQRPGFESDRFQLMLLDRQSQRTKPLAPDFDNWVEELDWAPDSKSIVFVGAVEAPREPLPCSDRRRGRGSPLEGRLGDGAGVLAGWPAPLFLRELVHGSRRPLEPPRRRQDRVCRDASERLPAGRGEAGDRPRALRAVGRRPQAAGLADPSAGLRRRPILSRGLRRARRPAGRRSDAWCYRWNLAGFAGYGYVVYAATRAARPASDRSSSTRSAATGAARSTTTSCGSADDLETLPYVDKERIGAAGASFGGYMMDWFAGHTTRFATLFCHDGDRGPVGRPVRDRGAVVPRMEFGGWPWESDAYEKWNPIRVGRQVPDADAGRAHESDFRVPVEQGYSSCSRRCSCKGVPSKLLVFPDEGHWVLKPGNALFWHNELVDWLARWLGGAPADPAVLARAYSVTK